MDTTPGWHALLGVVHEVLGLDKFALVSFSVFVLFLVFVLAPLPLLRRPEAGEAVVEDYASLGLSLRHHPLELLRPHLDALGVSPAEALWGMADGSPVRVGGIVITRQRPGTASGVTFVTLEDEGGSVNLVVWRRIADRDRRALLGSRLLIADGEVQREGDVIHVVVERLHDRSELLGELTVRSRDFR